MSKPLLLIVGAGGHARAAIDVIEQEDHYRIAGLVGLPQEVGSLVLSYPVLGCDADLPKLSATIDAALVGLGQIKQPAPRQRLFELLIQLGWNLPSIVSPRATVSRHAKLGAGTLVMHGAVINAGAEVGVNCIVNSLSLIEHDARVGNHCHISTGALLNGGVVVGDGGFVGSGAVIREGVLIGEHSFIGLGQRILTDCPPGSILTSKK